MGRTLQQKSKPKTETETLRAQISQLKRDLETEQAARRKAEEAHCDASARLKAANLLLEQVRLEDLGISQRCVFIEQIDQAESKEESETILACLLDQDGCLGGRVLGPHEGGWRAQTFWPADPAPNATYLFEIFSALLLPGQHYRVVPESLRCMAGFKQVALRADTEQNNPFVVRSDG